MGGIITDKNNAIIGDSDVTILYLASKYGYSLGSPGLSILEENGSPIAKTHFSPNCVYLAQPITGLIDCTPPKYFYELDVFLAGKNHQLINPIAHPYTFAPNTPHEVIVETDLLMVNHCKAVVLDLTRGYSVGATVEAAHAHDKDIPIIGVSKQPKRESCFAHYLCKTIVKPKNLYNELESILLPYHMS